MKTAKQAAREARQLYRFCLVNGALDQARARQVVQTLVDSRRRGQLDLLRQFQRWVKLEYARHTAVIESVASLPSDLQARVRARVETVYGRDVKAMFAQNQDLIAGMRIKIGSDVYDGSVRAGLAALEKTFA